MDAYVAVIWTVAATRAVSCYYCLKDILYELYRILLSYVTVCVPCENDHISLSSTTKLLITAGSRQILST